VVGDFNGDGVLDLAVANVGSNTVSVMLGLGNGTFGARRHFAVVNYPISLAVGDFNGDGVLDLAVANAGSDSVSVLIGLGDGAFAIERRFGAGRLPHSIAVGDFDGDGVLDLAVANHDNASVSVLLGVGNGTFGAERRFTVAGHPDSVAVGDFNRDGVLDLVVANSGADPTYFGSVSVLLGRGDGSFGAENRFGAGSETVFVAVGDFNRDDRLDIAVVNVLSNDVGLLLNNTP